MATNASQVWMRIVGNATNSDLSIYPTASAGGVANQVVYAAFASYKTASTPAIPTATGTNCFSAAWSLVTTVSNVSTRLTALSSYATSATVGVLTFDLGGEIQTAAAWDVVTSPYIKTSAPTVQSSVATDSGAGTTLTVTLPQPFTAAENWALSWFAQQSTSAPSVPALPAAAYIYNQMPGASNVATSDGLGLRGNVASTTSTINTVAGNVQKVAIAIEVAQDGTGVVSGGGGGIMRAGTSGGMT